MINNILIIWA